MKINTGQIILIDKYKKQDKYVLTHTHIYIKHETKI